MTQRLVRQQLVVANGANTSTQEVDGFEYALVGLIVPAGWTAAAIAFVASCDDGPGGTFWPVHSGGTEVALTASAGSFNGWGGADVFESLSGMPRFKVCSGPSTARVAQGAERTLWALLAPRA